MYRRLTHLYHTVDRRLIIRLSGSVQDLLKMCIITHIVSSWCTGLYPHDVYITASISVLQLLMGLELILITFCHTVLFNGVNAMCDES